METDRIDLDEPLGDASEVYGTIATGTASFSIETEYVMMANREIDESEVFIDEIHDGEIALTTLSEEGESRFSALAQLGPDAARQLGIALLRSADYAERQRRS